MTSSVSTAGIDPQLKAFIHLFPPADLTNPVTARKTLTELAGAAPAPDTTTVAAAAARQDPSGKLHGRGQ